MSGHRLSAPPAADRLAVHLPGYAGQKLAELALMYGEPADDTAERAVRTLGQVAHIRQLRSVLVELPGGEVLRVYAGEPPRWRRLTPLEVVGVVLAVPLIVVAGMLVAVCVSALSLTDWWPW